MCRALDIHRGGLYGWLKQPESKRAIEDKRLLRQIKQFWMESGFSYGYRNITFDMKDQGESRGKKACTALCEKLAPGPNGAISGTGVSRVATKARR